MSDKIEHELNATHFSGEASGWEGAAALLRQEAANAFLQDNEKLARMLKSIATGFDEREREARARQKKEQMEAEEES